MKICKSFFAIVLVLVFSLPVSAAEEKPVSVRIDNQLVRFSYQLPVIIDGRVLVPVDGVFEKLGFEAYWLEAAQKVRLEGPYFYIEFGIDSAEYMIFTDIGVTIRRLDVPAQTINGHAMIPLRAAAEAIGGTTEWDEENKTALIWRQI